MPIRLRGRVPEGRGAAPQFLLRLWPRGFTVCLCPGTSRWCWESQTVGAAQHRHGASGKENWPVACMGWLFRSVAFDTVSRSAQGLYFLQNKVSPMLYMMISPLGRSNQRAYCIFVKGSQETLAVHLCVATCEIVFSFFLLKDLFLDIFLIEIDSHHFPLPFLCPSYLLSNPSRAPPTFKSIFLWLLLHAYIHMYAHECI